MKRALTRLPFFARLSDAGPETLRDDAIAGMTTTIMMVPQGMAYASLAGLPPVHGLYAALIPSLVYALVGSSRCLSVGPVAIDSMIVAAGLAPLGITKSGDYAAAAALLMMLVGLIQMVVRALRLGRVARFVRAHILVGFTAGAAVHIGASQLGPIFGLRVPRGLTLPDKLLYLIGNLGEASTAALVLASAGVVLLLGFKRSNLRFLIVLAVSSLAAWLASLSGESWLGQSSANLQVVGQVPAGLPSLASPLSGASIELILALLPTAAVLAAISFIGTVAVGKSLDGDDPLWSAGRELSALSWANVLGAWFQAYSVSGGFSRSVVNHQAGAKTSVAGVVAALGVALALLWFTPLFYWLPTATLGAIIVVATMSLFKIEQMKALWKNERTLFALMALTVLSVLILGVVEGLILGIALDALMMLARRRRV